MQLENRQRLGFLASLGWTMRRIAEDMGWSAQTIANELLNRRVDSDKRHGCSNRLCAHYEECRLESYTATGKGLRKNQPKCFEACPDFREESCHRLARPPFVCNGCEKEHNCPMRKKFYIPEAAQANYEGTLRNSRTGIVRIPSNQVTLHPFLLGQKYQRAADRAILKKNGVIAKKPESDK